VTDFVTGRQRLIEALREELVGPASRGIGIDTAAPLVFATWADARGPYREISTGEEILIQDSPTTRYGVGVLYPTRSQELSEIRESAGESQASLGPVHREDDAFTEEERPIGPHAERQLEDASETVEPAVGGETDDFDLSTAHSFRPSTIALSFLVALEEQGRLVATAGGGRYERLSATVEGRTRSWWVRRPVELMATVARTDLGDRRALRSLPLDVKPIGPLKLGIEMYLRPHGPGLWLMTACLVNRSQGTELDSDRCLFQSWLKVEVSGGPGSFIRPYPSAPHETLDEEDQSNELLYRHLRTFAVGHGCAADWTSVDSERAKQVRSEILPVVSVPSISADAVDSAGTKIEISIAKLAGLVKGEDGLDDVDRLTQAYAKWIEDQQADIPELSEDEASTARKHLARCGLALQRMRRGMELVSKDPLAKTAFRLANEAILIQQLRYQRQSRPAAFDAADMRLSFKGSAPHPDLSGSHPTLGRWRAFQIAFVLSALPSVDDPGDAERETVELIWFPTGGGKTEAYLALAAYAIIRRRLRDSGDRGLEVLMRYTLRLLTAQQFQRAAALVVALEHLRRRSPERLGSDPFSIGIWVGGATTPLRRAEAMLELKGLLKKGVDADNPFLILRCPWCSAQMGPVKLGGRGAPKVLGYVPDGPRVRFRCPDLDCDFHDDLPILVVDEDIYETPPSMLIATVDKFAMLAWRPDARTIFGLDGEGKRTLTPPSLIIQDELHLISGPLGSMVGLYESVIEELCTDRRQGRDVRPKIVSSTATIRNYREQVRALYCRNAVELFPPPGLDISNSFFARHVDDEGDDQSKLYVGVHAPGLNSLQTVQIRVYTSLLQAVWRLPEAERDPWWTLVCFYNSLRELGGGVSLFQTDIPDYTRVVRSRDGLPSVRYLRNPMELTGRASSEDVPKTMEALERPFGTAEPAVDVCLASSIFEVGIDIERLSLMAVVGQPKTTSQYIQVTGRVGRKWWERPGLIVTLYSASKPRDRSHFEQFRSYHERLYAQVEPTSVTPFSASALTRALHAAMAVYCRQQGSSAAAEYPHPYPSRLVEELGRVLHRRVTVVDPTELDTLLAVLKRRAGEWEAWKPVRWAGAELPTAHDAPLLVPAGAYVPPEWVGLSWPTPQSLRNVDAECQATITSFYLSATEDPIAAASS